MKRIILISALLFCSVLSVWGQDAELVARAEGGDNEAQNMVTQ